MGGLAGETDTERCRAEPGNAEACDVAGRAGKAHIRAGKACGVDRLVELHHELSQRLDNRSGGCGRGDARPGRVDGERICKPIVGGLTRDPILVLIERLTCGIGDIRAKNDLVGAGGKRSRVGHPVSGTCDESDADGRWEDSIRAGDREVGGGETGEQDGLGEGDLEEDTTGTHRDFWSVVEHTGGGVFDANEADETVFGFATAFVEVLIEQIAGNIGDPGADADLVIALGGDGIESDAMNGGGNGFDTENTGGHQGADDLDVRCGEGAGLNRGRKGDFDLVESTLGDGAW